MSLCTATAQLPGIYPHIAHYNPHQKRRGQDNLGIGYTEHGEQFMLKPGGSVGVAEFIGAKVSDACGLPACQPTVVTLDTADGLRHVFGSRIESGVHVFDQSSVEQWQQILLNCQNASAFSALLAIDLVLGNDDRHWNNWLVQKTEELHGKEGYRLRAMDFSRSWPVRHPAQHPLRHQSSNTWDATQHWELLGVTFCPQIFYATCAKIDRLPARWLRSVVLQPLVGVFINTAQADALGIWWEYSLRDQVVETIHSLEYGVWP